MKWLIRIICFAITTLIYVPIETALHNSGANSLLIGFITIVIYLFVFLVPSNALIAMWNNQPKRKVNLLCSIMWQAAAKFAGAAGIAPSARTLAIIWTSLYYSVLDIIRAGGVEDLFHREFVKTACNLFKKQPGDLLFTGIILTAKKDLLTELSGTGIDPLTKDGLDQLLFLVLLYTTDGDSDEELFPDALQSLEYLRAVQLVTDLAVRSFPKVP